jgi:hypothetical protein
MPFGCLTAARGRDALTTAGSQPQADPPKCLWETLCLHTHAPYIGHRPRGGMPHVALKHGSSAVCELSPKAEFKLS